jgi:hypothetical protein
MISAEPVVLPRAFLLHADHGGGELPAFPAPSFDVEGGMPQPNSGASRRETTAACLRLFDN